MIHKTLAGAAIAVIGLGVPAIGVSAADCPDSTATACSVVVKPTPIDPLAPSVVGPSVNGKQQLPVTGGDATSMALAGGALILGGSALVMGRRKLATADKA